MPTSVEEGMVGRRGMGCLSEQVHRFGRVVR
jgi:hypothetical protein